jgi:hypothetical protein
MCTPPPTGFIAIAATRSDETAAVGVIPKKISRIGVMSAPPPMPVRPTVNPTSTEASTMPQSMSTSRLRRRAGVRRDRRHHLVVGQLHGGRYPASS